MKPTARQRPGYGTAVAFCGLALACLAPASGPVTSGPEASLQIAAVFPLAESGPGLVLPVAWDGDPLPLVLDTGSLTHFLDEGFSSRLGPRLSQQQSWTPVGTRLTAVHRLPSGVRLGPIELQGQQTGLFSMSTLPWPGKSRPSGTMGLAAMQHHFWDFDFDAQTLTLANPPAAGPDDQPVPVDSLINLPVTLEDGRTLPFLLDTGCSAAGTLEAALFDELRAAGKLFPLPDVTISTSATPESRVQQGKLSRLTFQSDHHSGLQFLRGNANRLGWPFFTRYHWQICLSRGLVSTLPRQSSPSKTITTPTPITNQKP
jgi:hypothetical protein